MQVYIDLLYRATSVHVPTGAPAPPRNPSGNPGTAGSGAQGPLGTAGLQGAMWPALRGRACLSWRGGRAHIGRAGIPPLGGRTSLCRPGGRANTYRRGAQAVMRWAGNALGVQKEDFRGPSERPPGDLRVALQTLQERE